MPAEGREGSVLQGLHGARAFAEDPRHFRDGKVSGHPQHDHGALVRG
jgi:hypothetical protein